MSIRIAVVDYCKGNLASVQRSIGDAGYDAFVTQNPAEIEKADGIILPGVGAFRDAADTMVELGEMDAIKTRVKEGVPFLGICLGLHLIFDWGDEGCEPGTRVAGLGLLPGHIEHVPATDESGKKYKVPHVGWNSVELQRDWDLFEGVPNSEYFYFTHSYCAVPDNQADIAALTEHARTFVSAVGRDHIYGVQFHPEKSSKWGLQVMRNFGGIVSRAAGK